MVLRFFRRKKDPVVAKTAVAANAPQTAASKAQVKSAPKRAASPAKKPAAGSKGKKGKR